MVKFDSPASWRLASNDDMDSEATFRVQGILCGFELPPVQRWEDTICLSIVNKLTKCGQREEHAEEEILHAAEYNPDGSVN